MAITQATLYISAPLATFHDRRSTTLEPALCTTALRRPALFLSSKKCGTRKRQILWKSVVMLQFRLLEHKSYPYDIASHSTNYSPVSIEDSDPASIEPGNIIAGENHNHSLSCAKMDQHLTTRRKNPTDFKQLLKREDHYRRITVAQVKPFERDHHIWFKILKNYIASRQVRISMWRP